MCYIYFIHLLIDRKPVDSIISFLLTYLDLFGMQIDPDFFQSVFENVLKVYLTTHSDRCVNTGYLTTHF